MNIFFKYEKTSILKKKVTFFLKKKFFKQVITQKTIQRTRHAP